jgi:uncharacterized Tic20 family protein
MSQTMTPNHDERTLAALAHLSILLNLITLVGGLIAAGIIYLQWRERSAYVAQQAVQALFFQLGLWGLTLVGGVLSWVLTAGLTSFCLVPGGVLLWAVSTLYALRGAMLCLRGRAFHYLLL